jgi:phosphoglycolate phosphatase-like HAD superfamily hydrolase
MFGQMREALGITKSVDILDHIYSLPHPAREKAMESVRRIEREAMVAQKAQPGLRELMTYLDSRNIRKGICTRNFETPVAHLLSKFLAGSHFHPIVTRDFRPPKPDPAGILHIALSWGHTKPSEASEETEEVPDATGLIMVGDSIDDMEAGRRAGAATVLLVNDVNRHLAGSPSTDMTINSLDELVDILEQGFNTSSTEGNR